MKPSLRSRSESGRRSGRGEGGAEGRILYRYVGRGEGAGIVGFRRRSWTCLESFKGIKQALRAV